jgi:hypothetical protein
LSELPWVAGGLAEGVAGPLDATLPLPAWPAANASTAEPLPAVAAGAIPPKPTAIMAGLTAAPDAEPGCTTSGATAGATEADAAPGVAVESAGIAALAALLAGVEPVAAGDTAAGPGFAFR